MNKKLKMNKMALSLVIALTIVFSLNLIYSAETATVNSCCEKTLSGAWCQNAPVEQCDTNYKVAPTSCDSASYCKPGCCFDTKEGLCMESTPRRVCEAGNGSWADSKECQIAQCDLGCCILGNQGAFVTLTRCKAMSGFYGLNTTFKKTITNELSCIAAAQSTDMGACVYSNGVGGKTCKFESRAECKTASLTPEAVNLSDNSTLVNGSAPDGFYKDTLCTSSELGTDCGKSKKTTILEGKDEVYYVDTCGNPANIYDASRYDDKTYWNKVVKKADSCGAGQSNAGSRTCGNCDYYLGSIGKKSTNVLGRATYGDYICIDLGCKKEGKKHGESWCVTDSPTGNGEDPVGSRYYKEVCLYGEVITEPCADYRNEICIEGSFNGFTEAACRVNRWQDCTSQEEEADCTNTDVRDCTWVSGYYFSSSSNQVEKSNDDPNKGDLTPSGLCTPNYPPGFNFWGNSNQATTTNANATSGASFSNPSGYGTGFVNPTSSGTNAGTSICSKGNAVITVKWEKIDKPLQFWQKSGDWECVENCQYADGEGISNESAKTWASEMNSICYKLGDCGGYVNWVGKYTEEGFAAYFNKLRIAGSGGAERLETKKTTSSNFSNPVSSGSSSGNNAAQTFSAASNLVNSVPTGGSGSSGSAT